MKQRKLSSHKIDPIYADLLEEDRRYGSNGKRIDRPVVNGLSPATGYRPARKIAGPVWLFPISLYARIVGKARSAAVRDIPQINSLKPAKRPRPPNGALPEI